MHCGFNYTPALSEADVILVIDSPVPWIQRNHQPRSLSTKQAAGLIRLSLPDGRGQAIIPFSADDPSMTQMRGEQ